MSWLDQIDRNNIPRHIAVIMDGNGRWAKQKGAMRIFGHQNAIQAVRDVTEGCAELGVQYLTLYAFSTENWNRPQEEVNALMELLVSTIRSEVKTLLKNDIQLDTIGEISELPQKCQRELAEAKELTRQGKMKLILALNYSGRSELLRAAKLLMEEGRKQTLESSELNEERFAQYLYTSNIPDPELLIRTSGEMRISNFLLWQLAYTELYITKVLWPDFRKEHLRQALLDYQSRERRFGMTSEQLITK